MPLEGKWYMSMKKLEETTGDVTISSISQKKNRRGVTMVEVTFDDGQTYSISEDAYLSTFIYPGKKLSKNEWNDIVAITNQSSNRSYVTKLLSGRLYSPKQLVDKLMQIRKMSYVDANLLVDTLQKEGIIDARSYAENRIDSLLMKGYSKEKIRDILKDEGITDEMIEELSFKIEEENIEVVLKILSSKARIYQNDSQKVMRKKLEMEMYKLGYSSYQSESILDQFAMENSFLSSDSRQKEALLKAVHSSYDKILRNEKLIPSQRKNELYKRLMAKGFSREEIDDVLAKEEIQI